MVLKAYPVSFFMTVPLAYSHSTRNCSKGCWLREGPRGRGCSSNGKWAVEALFFLLPIPIATQGNINMNAG